MFGYMEQPYTVNGSKKRMSQNFDDGRYAIFELREDQQKQYISRDRYSKDDEFQGNTLYIYKDCTLVDLDWSSIWKDAEIDAEKFQHHERIEDHGTGYTKDGCICMY